MKKVITVAIALAAFAPAFALASVVCDAPDHPVYAPDGTTIYSCITDAAWQASAAQAASLANKHLPVVPSGSVIVDEAGISYQVPNIIYPPGWVDVTHTDAYRAQMRFLAQQLNGFDSLAYWLTH